MSFPTVNQTAFATVTSLGIAATASAIAAATVASTVATVAYATLAITLGAVSIASVTAWVKTVSEQEASSDKYFKNIKDHAGYAIAGTYQLVAQTIIQALITGISEGIIKAVREKIGGKPTIRVKQ